MIASDPLAALTAEAARLSAVLADMDSRDWSRPTRCEPWDAAALVAHTTRAIGRVEDMLDAAPPQAATVSATGYYAPDERFSPGANTDRVETALEAARIGGPALAAAFDATMRRVTEACEQASPGRLVTTRHGDAMTLEDFLTTRVVEAAVHGIDLADAIGRDRWTTPEAADCVTRLMLGDPERLADLAWDPVTFIAKATGRDRLQAAERDRVETLGVTWLALG